MSVRTDFNRSSILTEQLEMRRSHSHALFHQLARKIYCLAVGIQSCSRFDQKVAAFLIPDAHTGFFQYFKRLGVDFFHFVLTQDLWLKKFHKTLSFKAFYIVHTDSLAIGMIPLKQNESA
jgi:hypothetical protein